MEHMRRSLLLLLALLGVAGTLLGLRKPSNDRPWKPDYARNPWVEFEGDVALVRNVRNNRYGAPGTSYDTVWEDRSYDLGKVKRLWFAVEPFNPKVKAIAHTFLSFEFEDDFLALSVEARTEVGETFSILEGLIGSFEILYSFGDERDFILRRTNYLEHEVYLYPLVTKPDEVRAILQRVFEIANDLVERPQFYNSIMDNCTSSLKRLANEVRPKSFPPFMLAQVLPGRTDSVLYRKGWIDTTVPLEALRDVHSVEQKAGAYADDPEFSRRIREG